MLYTGHLFFIQEIEPTMHLIALAALHAIHDHFSHRLLADGEMKDTSV